MIGCTRVAEGDTIVDGRRTGTVTLVSRDMPRIVAVDFEGVLSIVDLDAVLVRDVHSTADFTAYLASENGWELGRTEVVVRQMLLDAGLPRWSAMTELAWLALSAAYFAADVHAATWRELGA
jgi:hypothetical protein